MARSSWCSTGRWIMRRSRRPSACRRRLRARSQWADARTLRFTPAQPLQRGALYDVTLGQAAKAADGAPINGAYQFRFATAGFLEVGQVIPADGAQDVQAGSAITVLFNRPVVPLTVVEQQGNAPQPLTLRAGDRRARASGSTPRSMSFTPTRRWPAGRPTPAVWRPG